MNKRDFEEMVRFIAARNEAEKNLEHDFVCTICGGHAHWIRSDYNNHLAIRCDDCGYMILE